MENEEVLLNNMNNILLSLNLKDLNQNIINNNIKKIAYKLENLDEKK